MEEAPTQPEEIIEELPQAGLLEKIKTHKFKILAGVLGILVLVGAAFGAYKFSQKQGQPTPQPTLSPAITPLLTPTVEPTSTPTPEPTADWKTHTDTECGFSIKHPEELTVDESRECVHFSLWGPTQKAETEFYDGISLLFGTGNLGGKTLKDLVDEKADESEVVGEILISPTEATIAGMSGFTYKSRGLGEFTCSYVSPKPGIYLEVIDATVDPAGKGFQATVDLMLSTLKLL